MVGRGDLGGERPVVGEVVRLSGVGDLFYILAVDNGWTLRAVDIGGVKLKRLSGACGIAIDDKAYCWQSLFLTPPNAPRLLPGQ